MPKVVPMKTICLMKNAIQPYPWGSHTAIAALRGDPVPSKEPQAEMWMGAHGKAPSRLWYQGRWQSLDQLIAQYPVEMLGARVLDRLGNTLPFLFKVLAAAQPLSIQAHPDSEQARLGFARENAAGIPLDAARRNYRDDRHKPEILCALTPFWGLCGFRSIAEMMVLMGPVWPPSHNHALTLLTRRGIRPFFQYLMALEDKPRAELVERVLQNVSKQEEHADLSTWIHKLAGFYKEDIGVLFPLLLNLVRLSPGQAIFLPAGQLHAYLDGTGVELMANSDNVLRGGLTGKHIDVPELLNVLDFASRSPDLLEGSLANGYERVYPSRAPEFRLSRIDFDEGPVNPVKICVEGPEVLLCTAGRAILLQERNEAEITVTQGQSAFIPAAASAYTLAGRATLFRATINL